MIGGSVLEVGLWLREVPSASPVLLERLAQARTPVDMSTTTQVAALPMDPRGRSTTPVLERWVRPAPGPPGGRRRPVRTGVLNVVFALAVADPRDPPGRPLAALRRPPAVGDRGPGRRPGPVGLARGVRRGSASGVGGHPRGAGGHHRRPAGSQGTLARGSTLALVFCLWLLVEHQHFRVRPTGVSRAVHLGGRRRTGRHRRHGRDRQPRGYRPPRPLSTLVFLLVVVVVLGRPAPDRAPGRESRRTGTARQEAFDRARAIIETHGGDTLDYFALRDDKSWFFTGESLVAYSVINGVMLVSPDPIGPPRGPGRGVVGRHGHGPGQQLAALGAGCLAVVAGGSTGPPDWSTTTSGTRPSLTPPRSI